MGSRDRGREKDQTAQHNQSHISSLVVRPSVSDGGDGGRGEGGQPTGGGDYEPGEVQRGPRRYSRSDRYKGDLGHRTRPSSSSPSRRADGDHRYGSDLDHSRSVPRGRELYSRREVRYRDQSQPHVRDGAGSRPNGKGVDNMNRNNNPNVRPREGDWFCPDPLCKNLNFARREYCNNCKRPRYTLAVGPPPPRRDYTISPLPSRRFPVPPMDLSLGRGLNGYRSPPRGWPRDAPRDAILPPRHDHSAWNEREPERERERLHYPDDEYTGKRPPFDWVHTDRGGRRLLSKPNYGRRLPHSPRLPPPRGRRWGRDVRDRSRSPVRNGLPPLRDYHHDGYIEGGRDERNGSRGRGGSRGRWLGNPC